MSDDFGLAIGLLAAVSLKSSGRRAKTPPPTRDYFMRDARGTLYYVDAKGTRRRATADEEAQFSTTPEADHAE
jgi:hypothetical protein